MASVISYYFCDSCKEKGIKSKATALCFGCEKLLCEECKRCHLTFKDDDSLNLVDLRPFLSDPSFYQNLLSLKSAQKYNEAELISSYHDVVRRIEKLDPCFKTQISKKSTSQSLTSCEAFKHLDPRRMRSQRDIVFKVDREEDKYVVHIEGLLCISDTIIVVDKCICMLKMFDVNGEYLSSTEVDEAIKGITHVHDKTFATCGIQSHKIYIWTLLDQKKFQKSVLNQLENASDGIHFNGTYFCLLHRKLGAVSILNENGRQIRMILVEQFCEEKIELGIDIHMDSGTNNIYLPCYSRDGILCMTIEGQALWFIALLNPPQGIIDIQGTLYVSAWRIGTIHLISKDGQYVKKLLDTEYGLTYMSHGNDNKLYVCFNIMGKECNNISVLKLDDNEDENKEEEACVMTAQT